MDVIGGPLQSLGVYETISQRRHDTAARVFGDLGCSLLDIPGRQRIEHDIGPRGCQHLRNAFADAPPGSGNKDNFMVMSYAVGNIFPPLSL